MKVTQKLSEVSESQVAKNQNQNQTALESNECKIWGQHHKDR